MELFLGKWKPHSNWNLTINGICYSFPYLEWNRFIFYSSLTHTHAHTQTKTKLLYFPSRSEGSQLLPRFEWVQGLSCFVQNGYILLEFFFCSCYETISVAVINATDESDMESIQKLSTQKYGRFWCVCVVRIRVKQYTYNNRISVCCDKCKQDMWISDDSTEQCRDFQ